MRSMVLALVLSLGGVSGCDTDNRNQALGTLERDRVILKATASEIILAQPIAEGTQVEAGTVLVQLDPTRQQAIVAHAKAELAKALAEQAELRNGARPEEIASASAQVKGATAALKEAQTNYQRAVSMVQQQLAAQSHLDTTRALRDEAQARLDSANEELLRLTNGTRQEQLDRAAAAVQAAEANLALETHQLSELSVVATRDGYLDNLPWNVGERVTSGSTIAIMLADNLPYARVYIPEPFRTRLKVGEHYPVHIDGLDQTLQGKLRWIATDPSFTPYYALNASDRARLVYVAEFDISDGQDLPTGVPAQVILSEDSRP